MIDPGNSQRDKEMDEVAVPEQQESLQEQQQPQEQKVDSETEPPAEGEIQVAADETAASETPASRGKKRVKKVRQVTEAELMPHPSIWPLMLAFSVAVMLGGFAFNLIILGVGVILVIVSIIGWNLERR